MNDLNVRRERFCRAYVELGYASRAYLSSFSRCSKGSARAGASRLLTYANVRARIAEILREEMPIDELAFQAIARGLNAKKLVKVRGGYVKYPDHKKQLRTAEKTLKMMGHLD